MRTIPWCLLIAHLAAGVAHAQTPNDLQVRLGAYTSSTDGGEKPVGVWFSTGPVAIGKRVTSTFSVGETCDAFSVSSDGSLRERATAAWRIDVTPTRVRSRRRHVSIAVADGRRPGARRSDVFGIQ